MNIFDPQSNFPKFAYYLIEGQNEVREAALKCLRERQEHIDRINQSLKDAGIQNAKWSLGAFGNFCGVHFENEVPENWSEPSGKHGLSVMKRNHPRYGSIPKQGFKKVQDYFPWLENIPFEITFRNRENGSCISSSAISDLFQPVKLVYGKQVLNHPEDCPIAVCLPDYGHYLKLAKEFCPPKQYFTPSEKFDYPKLLPGCRIVSHEEWQSICSRWNAEKGSQP